MPFELAVTQARASVAQERARHEQAQHEAERLRPLADTKAISHREYDQAVSNLKAPIGGITGRAARSEGSLIAANTDLLTTITQVDPIWIRFSLAESDFERVRGSGQTTQVNIVQQDGTIAAPNGRLNFTGST